MERSYGVLKRRFPVLSTGMAIRIQTVQDVIVATCILHNVAIVERDPQPREVATDRFNELHEVFDAGGEATADHDNGRETIRQQLLLNYFGPLAERE